MLRVPDAGPREEIVPEAPDLRQMFEGPQHDLPREDATTTNSTTAAATLRQRHELSAGELADDPGATHSNGGSSHAIGAADDADAAGERRKSAAVTILRSNEDGGRG